MTVAALAAYEDARIGREDLHLLELHDAAAPAKILQYAEVGRPEEGHLPAHSGATALGGLSPVNVSGRLMSRGHPIGATGYAQLAELYDQLLGRADGRSTGHGSPWRSTRADGSRAPTRPPWPPFWSGWGSGWTSPPAASARVERGIVFHERVADGVVLVTLNRPDNGTGMVPELVRDLLASLTEPSIHGAAQKGF
ncbi:thiolase C-terminal domain-containing protein [Streptomyces acidicola]|uniref:thiolase C-terminal domain-containing protein n=1 Tax=Streptomyces acidicola TaxID=2596892 RepID=UPI00341E14E4